MDSVQTIKKVLLGFNRNNVRYCILRNYEPLLGKAGKLDGVDTILAKKDANKAYTIAKKHGFIKRPRAFTNVHQGCAKAIKDNKDIVSFDMQIGGISWNDYIYLKNRDIISRRIKKCYFFVPSDEDSFVMFIVHSILGKRYFKKKYKKILIELSKKKLDLDYISDKIRKVFFRKTAEDIMDKVMKNDIKSIEKNISALMINFIFKNPRMFFILPKVFVKWFIRKFRLYPMITFMGPDGSGKTTNAEMTCKLLNRLGKKADIVYSGRGKKNVLPIKKIGNLYKKHEEKRIKSKTFRQILYTIALPFYSIDLLIRYWFIIFPKRLSGKVVITDRYCSDILLMNYVPLSLKKVFLMLFPKPSLTFFLYNKPEILYSRRRQQPIEELKSQLNLFEYLKKRFKSINVKTTNIKSDFKHISKKTVQWVLENGF